MIENLLLVYVVSAVLYFCWNIWRAHVGDLNTIEILSLRCKLYESDLFNLRKSNENNKKEYLEAVENKNKHAEFLTSELNKERERHTKTIVELDKKKNFINDLLCEIDALKSLNQKRKVTK